MLSNNNKMKVWQDPSWFIAFGFGSGLMPVAPGTWGTLAAFPVYLLMTGLSMSSYVLLTLVLFFIGVGVCARVTRELGIQDFSGIVWDEVIGLLVTMIGVPVGFCWLMAGFLLFRFFDIWKPWPIRLVDKHIHGGLGIMLDDVLAALPACLILHGFAWVLL